MISKGPICLIGVETLGFLRNAFVSKGLKVQLKDPPQTGQMKVSLSISNDYVSKKVMVPFTSPPWASHLLDTPFYKTPLTMNS